MSQDLDVRAKIYCNLGPVISGDLEDTSVIGTGLLSTTGKVLLDGVYRVTPGDKIELAYYKNGRVARLGRSLLVLSTYANPMTRTTELAVGCRLAYLANTAPPPRRLYSKDDPNAPELTELEKRLVLKPMTAKFLVEEICSLLDIQHGTVPLTNIFYKQQFDLSGPYLQVLSALLVSENYVGYMDSQDTLQFIDLTTEGGTGPVLDETNIIDVQPVNEPAPDPDIVYSVVNYTKLKLDNSLLLPVDRAPDAPEATAENDFQGWFPPGSVRSSGAQLSVFVNFTQGFGSFDFPDPEDPEDPEFPPATGGGPDDAFSYGFISTISASFSPGYFSDGFEIDPNGVISEGFNQGLFTNFSAGYATIDGLDITDSGPDFPDEDDLETTFGSLFQDLEELKDVLERNNLFDLEPISDDFGPLTQPDPDEDPEAPEITYPDYWLRKVENNGSAFRKYRYEDKDSGIEEEETSFWEAISEVTTQHKGDGTVLFSQEVLQGPWGLSFKETFYQYENYTEYELVRKTEIIFVPGPEVVESIGFPDTIVKPLPSAIFSFASNYNVGGLIKKSVFVETQVATATAVVTRLSGSALAIDTAAGSANIQDYMKTYTDNYSDDELPSVLPVGTIVEMALQPVTVPTRTSYSQKPPDRSIKDASKAY